MAEINGMTPREARLYIMRKVAEPIYANGIMGLADLAYDPAIKQKIPEGGDFLNILTRQTHEKLRGLLPKLGLACAVLWGLLIFFSFRFGRFFSSGCVVIVASLPVIPVWLVSSAAGKEVPMDSHAVQEGALRMAGYLSAYILPGLARLVLPVYVIPLAAATLLLLIGSIGMLFDKGPRKPADEKEGKQLAHNH
jgi:hypothetical protein